MMQDEIELFVNEFIDMGDRPMDDLDNIPGTFYVADILIFDQPVDQCPGDIGFIEKFTKVCYIGLTRIQAVQIYTNIWRT